MLRDRISTHNEKILLGAIAVVAILALIVFAVASANVKPVTSPRNSSTGTLPGTTQSGLFSVVKGALCDVSTIAQHIAEQFSLRRLVAVPTGC